MATRVISLYLDDANIRLLIARGRKVERWASRALDEGLVDGGIILDEAKMADIISELIETAKSIKTEKETFRESIANFFSGKSKVIVGLSGRDSLYRVVSLPVLSDSLLAEAIRREAARVLPVSLDELYLAYHRIPSGSNEIRVFVAAFPKKTTDSLMRTLRRGGVRPQVLDLAPLALCLSVNEPRAIIVDVRTDNLNIIVLADRVPQVIRSLALQSEVKTLSENMPTIVEEFSRTVAFYNSSHQQDPLDEKVPVFVSGDLANAPDSWQSLVGRLHSNVMVLPSAIQYPDNFPVNDFMVNLGLATKELSLEKEPANYPLVNLNALPESALPKPVDLYRIVTPVVAVAGIAGIFFLWNNWQNNIDSVKSLESQLTSTQNLITTAANSIATLTEQNRLAQAQIQPVIDAANTFTVKLTNLQTARNLTNSDVHQISALKPETVAVTSISYGLNGATVNGSAAKQDDVLGYAQALRDTGGFTVVVSSITYSSVVTDTGAVISSYNFTLEIK